MTKTVIGLFDSTTMAQQVMQDLEHHDFARAAMSLVTNTAAEDLTSRLTAIGVPTDEARGYAEGVRRGEALVILEADDDARANQAVDIMERHRAPALSREPVREPAVPSRPPSDRERTPRGEAGETTVPVVEEQVQVGTRQVQRGGVRL
jgi:hypothetical protein